MAAAVATIACTAIGYEAALGHGGAIWKQVTASSAAHAGFNLVILSGCCGIGGHAARET